MPMTLAQQALLERNSLRKGIIMGLLEESFLMQRVPWENIGAFSTQVVLWKDLPNSVTFRRLNAAFGEGTGTVEQRQESVYDLGTDIDVDLLFTKDKNVIIDPRALQTKMQLKSIAYFFNDAFINGDQAVATWADGFNGLKVRIDQAHNRLLARSATYPNQLVTDADAAPYSGIDMSVGGRTAADVNKFLDALNDLIYSLDGHKCDALIMNDQAMMAIESGLREAQLLRTDKDMFDREITTYKGIPIVNLGVKADQVTRVIPTTSTKTDVYAVRWGVGEHLHGIQMAPLDTRDIGELESKPVLRTRIQWTFGLAQWHDRSCSRLKNLQVA